MHEEHAIRREPGTRTGFRMGVALAGLQDPGTRRRLRQLASAAVHDEHVAEVLAEFTAQRRAARDLAAHLIAAGKAGNGPA